MDQNETLSTLNKDISWLSELIQVKIKEQYPQLAPDLWHQRLASCLVNLFRWPIILALAGFFVLFLPINELLLACGVIFKTYTLEAQGISDILASFIDIVAATLGIVIPLIILVIEFLGRDSGSVIDIYLDETEIGKPALSAFIVLALLGAAKLVVRASLISANEFYFYTAALSLFSILAILGGVGFALYRISQLLSTDFFLQALLGHINTDGIRSQREEVEYRYGRIDQVELGEHLGLRYSYFWFSSKPPKNAIPLIAPKSGVITDIHIPKWRALSQLLNTTLGEKPGTKGYIHNLIGDFVSEGEAIVYVASEECHQLGALQRMLDQSLKIEMGKTSDLTRLLLHLKKMTQSAVREEDDTLYRQLLDVYLNIFRLGIDLPVPPSASLRSDFFPGWNVVSTIVLHLRDIIDVAAQSRNERLVDALAFKLSMVVEMIIDHSDTHVTESLDGVLGLFVAMYSDSRRYNNQRGMEASFSYLADSAVDSTWIGKFEDAYKDQKTQNNLKEILFAILSTLGKGIVRLIINHHDLPLCQYR